MSDIKIKKKANYSAFDIGDQKPRIYFISPEGKAVWAGDFKAQEYFLENLGISWFDVLKFWKIIRKIYYRFVRRMNK